MPEHALKQEITQINQQVANIQIQKWTGFGTAVMETGAKVWEVILPNTATGLIVVSIPANIGYSKITNVLPVPMGSTSAMTVPRCALEKTSLNADGSIKTTGFTLRVTKPKQITITKILSIGDVLDTEEACTDTSVKICLRVTGT